MTGKERILTALNRGQPDRVPVWELAFNEASIIALARNFMDPADLPPPQNVNDMTDGQVLQLVNAFRVMATELNLDGVTATSSAPMKRVDENHFRDVFGVIHHVSPHGEPYPVQGPIQGPEDLRKYRLRPPAADDFIMIDLMRANFADRAVGYIQNGPFFMSRCLRGSLQNLLLDYILEPGLAKDLARLATDYNLQCLELIAGKGADFVINDCDLAFNQATLMSPAQYDEFLHPYHREIVARAHQLGLKIVKHSDGRLKPLIPRFLEEGFDGLHPIQPQCLDLAEVKREFGRKICIMGNIDCVYLLVFGAPAEVRRSVRETIATAAAGGGYILSSSNTIHPGVKPENYIALVQAAREYGAYPV